MSAVPRIRSGRATSASCQNQPLCRKLVRPVGECNAGECDALARSACELVHTARVASVHSHGAIREHVEIVVTPLAGWAAGRCALEDQLGQ
jgi:hypothetical protein